LDSLVFLDDNPFERDLVRRELPMVAVPDLPQDPALYPQCLADAGYFESVSVTADDRERSAQYQANAARETAGGAAVDLGSYLTGLEMRLAWGLFDELNLKRLHQLINKTNQFNLTTRRYAEADVRAVMADDSAIGLHFRLSDRFGDNGVICVVILRRDRASDGDFVIDTWLMSCRVLGRGVEDAVLQVLRDQASAHGGRRLIGVYRPSGRNEMVADLYRRLGFSPIGATPDAGELQFALDLAGRSSPDAPIQAPIQIVKG
jgi:FkbH-like protein